MVNPPSLRLPTLQRATPRVSAPPQPPAATPTPAAASAAEVAPTPPAAVDPAAALRAVVEGTQPPAPAAPPPAAVAAPRTPIAIADLQAKLTPQAAADTSTALPPSDIRLRVETLRQLSPHVWAAMIAKGQGTIEMPSGILMTLRATDRQAPDNLVAIGGAVVGLGNCPGVARVEVWVMAEGTSPDASTVVVEEVLASLTAYNGSADTSEELLNRIEELVKGNLMGNSMGLHQAWGRLRALPELTPGVKQGASVQVILKQGDTVHNLWRGATVGFTLQPKGCYHPARGGDMPFARPDLPNPRDSITGTDSGNVADESVWLRQKSHDPELLGTAPYCDPHKKSDPLPGGGWFGMANCTLLGRNYGLGNIRHAITGRGADGVDRAVFSLINRLMEAMQRDKKVPVRLGNGGVPTPVSVLKGNLGLALGHEPLKRDRASAVRKANKLLRQAKIVADLATVNEANLLAAAALVHSNRYGDFKDRALIYFLLGMPPPAPPAAPP